ncbi:MAG: hypothetical protein Q9162_005855 [Coniocarpon cinnabarinum]
MHPVKKAQNKWKTRETRKRPEPHFTVSFESKGGSIYVTFKLQMPEGKTALPPKWDDMMKQLRRRYDIDEPRAKYGVGFYKGRKARMKDPSKKAAMVKELEGASMKKSKIRDAWFGKGEGVRGSLQLQLEGTK